MFGAFSCDTLDSYFQLCRDDDMRSPTPSVKGHLPTPISLLVQRKIADMSFSGMLISISSFLPKHASIAKGTSQSFFGTTASFTEALTPVDSADEGGALSLTASLHLPPEYVHFANSPPLSPNPVQIDEDTNSCRKEYRRYSVVCAPLPHDSHDGHAHDGGSHDDSQLEEEPDLDLMDIPSLQPKPVYENV